MFACVNMWGEKIIYLGNKEIQCIIKTSCIITVLFYHEMPFIS
jgi:hypothetical protein